MAAAVAAGAAERLLRRGYDWTLTRAPRVCSRALECAVAERRPQRRRTEADGGAPDRRSAASGRRGGIGDSSAPPGAARAARERVRARCF